MYLIVGLGNPGSKYTYTRHNIGFLAIDHLCETFQDPENQKKVQVHSVKRMDKKWNSEVSEFTIFNEKVFLLAPQTFMNLSGEALQPFMNFYKIDLSRLLVIHDEVDLPYFRMKFQKNRGPAGHNGLKSVNERLGTQDYARLKLGVGRPTIPGMQVSDWVLQNFSEKEMEQMPEYLNRSTEGVLSFLKNGFEKTMTAFNQKIDTAETDKPEK
ncbi:MAG: aminoacyl-tRNA hydrolase [Bdellovibrionales bacterium]